MKMELGREAIRDVVHPTAAFSRQDDPAENSLCQKQALPQNDWEHSQMNPKNRIDSLEPAEEQLWRIDGCTGIGTQYYAVPLFFTSLPPLRVDIFVPPVTNSGLRDLLCLDVAFHTKDAARLNRVPITRHILRTLQSWTRETFKDLGEFEQLYKSLPFGSRLVFENLSLNIHDINVRIGSNHNLERQLLSQAHLAELWGADFLFPREVDIFQLSLVEILHDSVCLVRIDDEMFIFKALTSGAKYLYHELKLLCSLKPHPYIIPRPVHLVKKTCNFGTKRAVVGFTTVFQPKGSLRDILPQLRMRGELRTPDQFKWSLQLAKALVHLRETSDTYYPDLRLDNIVLGGKDQIVMVDFEQRGVWCEFAAPEVNAFEYMNLLADEDEEEDDYSASRVHLTYLDKMMHYLPEYKELLVDQYNNPDDGYNVAWLCLSKAEQEAGEVYMLGRVLWCIFEGVSGPQKAAVWQSYRWESDLEFPEYRRTPALLRDLIDRCTKGRRETLSTVVVRQGSKLVLRGRPAATKEDIKAAARQFWKKEIKAATDLLDLRDRQKMDGTWVDNYYGRPTLAEALQSLEEIYTTIRNTCNERGV